jgi:hypothetical protein
MSGDESGLRQAAERAGFVLVPMTTSEPAAISLRDWFAGMWIAGAAGHHNTPDITDESKARRVASQAYRVADALVLERVGEAGSIAKPVAVEPKF